MTNNNGSSSKSSSKRLRVRRCICDEGRQCHGMSLAFQMLHDPRGGFVEVPPHCSSPPEYEFLHRQYLLRRAYLRHLRPHALLKGDTNNIGTGSGSDSDEPEFVALHHFHPKVVKKVAEAANGRGRSVHKYQVPLTLTPKEIKKLRLNLESVSGEHDRVRDVNGQVQDEYFFVPHYPIADAYEDLKQLSRAERSPKDISSDIVQNAKKAIQAQKEKQEQLKKEREAAKRKAKESKRKKKSSSRSSQQLSPSKLKEVSTAVQPQQQLASHLDDKVKTQSPPRSPPRQPTSATLKQTLSFDTSSPSSSTAAGTGIGSTYTAQSRRRHPVSPTRKAVLAADNNNTITRRPDGFDMTTTMGAAGVDSDVAVANSSRVVLDVSDKALAGSFKTGEQKTAAVPPPPPPLPVVDDSSSNNNNNKRQSLATDFLLAAADSDAAVGGSAHLGMTDASERALAGSSVVLQDDNHASKRTSLTIQDMQRRRSSATATTVNSAAGVRSSMDISNTTVVSGTVYPPTRSSHLHASDAAAAAAIAEEEKRMSASDSTVVANMLYASNASFQVTDQAIMHASSNGSSFHASDITPRASGGHRIMDVSDTTVLASNVAGTRRRFHNSMSMSMSNSSSQENMWGSTLSPAQIAMDFPLEEEPSPRRQSSILPKCETPKEEQQQQQQQKPPRSKAKSVTSTMVHAQVAMEFPLETLPRRKSDFMPACELPSELGLFGRSPMVITTSDSPPMKRKSATRESVRNELQNSSGGSPVKPLVETIPETSAVLSSPNTGAGKNELDISASEMRFTSSPVVSSRKRIQDTSPSTPRRMVSSRDIHAEEDGGLPELESMKKLKDESMDDFQHDNSNIDGSNKEAQRMSRSEDNVLVRAPSYEELYGENNRRRSAPLWATTDSKGKGASRRLSMPLSLDLDRDLDDSMRLFHSSHHRRASGSHHRSSSTKRLPPRTRSSDSGDMTGSSTKRLPPRTRSNDSGDMTRRRRWSHFGSRRSKSEDSTDGQRRRSESSVFMSKGSEHSAVLGDMSSSTRSRLGASRRIDSTRRAMQQYCEDYHRGEVGISCGRSERVARRLRKKPSRSRSASPSSRNGGRLRARSESPSTPLRRGRRTAIVATDGDELFKAGNLRRVRRLPRRTKSVDSTMDMSFSSLMAMKQDLGKRITSDPVPAKRISDPSQGNRTNAHLQRKRTSDPTARSRSRSPPPLMRANTESPKSNGGLRRCGTRPRGEGKRASDPEAARSLSPPPPMLKRAQTAEATRASRSRPFGRSLVSIEEGRAVSHSPRRSPTRTKSEISPTLKRGNCQIKRIDSSLRAMKQFVHDNGTVGDLGRTRSKNRLMRTRSVSPKRCRSPTRLSRGGSSGGLDTDTRRDADMNMSSPAVMGFDSMALPQARTSMPEMNASSPAALADEPSRERCNVRAGSCPPQAIQEGAAFTAEVSSPLSKHSNTSRSSTPTTSTNEAVSEEEESNESSDSSSHNLRTAADVGELNKQNSVKLAGTEEEMVNNQGNETNDRPMTDEKLVDDSIHMEDLNAAATSSGHESLNLEEVLAEDRSKAVLPEGFNFSFPLPKKSDKRKPVDWDSLGFHSSSPALQVASLDDEKRPLSFGLPRRLVAKKFRQQLLSEVVQTANRRQSTVAKRNIDGPAKRRDSQDSQELMKDIIEAATKKLEPLEPIPDDTEAPTYLPGGLLHSEKAGAIDDDDDEPTYLPGVLMHTQKVGKIESLSQASLHQSSLQLSAEKGSSHVSLSLDQVFLSSKEMKASPRARPKSPKTWSPKPSAQNSSVSLTLSRVFEESEEPLLQVSSRDGACELDESGCMEREKLRTVFPFRNIRGKKRESPHSSSSGETKVACNSGSTQTLAQDQKTTRSEQQMGRSPMPKVLPNIKEEDMGPATSKVPSGGALKMKERATQRELPPPLMPMTGQQKQRQSTVEKNIMLPQSGETSRTEQKAGAMRTGFNQPASPSAYSSSGTSTSSSCAVVAGFGSDSSSSLSTWSKPASAESNSKDAAPTSPHKEFDLSFPPAQALVSRKLPVTPDLCLSPRSPMASTRPRAMSMFPATNGSCEQTRLDRKIGAMDARLSLRGDIKFTPLFDSKESAAGQLGNGKQSRVGQALRT